MALRTAAGCAQANPELAAFVKARIGDGFVLDAAQLEGLKKYAEDPASLEDFMAIKRRNKERLAAYIREMNGVTVDPDSLFDVQVKRLHEYKRQHLNALHILHTYLTLKENPNMDFVPRTYLFGAKSAPATISPRRSSGSSAALPRRSTATRRCGIS